MHLFSISIVAACVVIGLDDFNPEVDINFPLSGGRKLAVGEKRKRGAGGL